MHTMVPRTPTGNQAELAKLRENQKKLVQALQRLFHLLERYAPSWYTEEHHDIASAALSATLVTNRKRHVTFFELKIR
jgi:hypothetical protein